MAISTFSKFFYGYEVTLLSSKFQWDEGSGEITATIPLGVYAPTDLAAAIEQELNAEGTFDYTFTFNRTTRTFTYTSSSPTDILVILERFLLMAFTMLLRIR